MPDQNSNNEASKKSWIDYLSPDQKNWVGRTLINVILVDKEISPNEIEYLERALIMLGLKEMQSIIYEKLGNKDYSLLPMYSDHSFSAVMSLKILYLLGMSAISDAHFVEREAKLIRLAGMCMGVDREYIKLTLIIFNGLNGFLKKNPPSSNGASPNKSWMDLLSDEQKIWLGKAIITIILIDRSVKPTELEYLEKAILLIGGEEAKAQIIANIGQYILNLKELEDTVSFHPHFALKVIYFLGYIALSDNSFDEKEASIMIRIANKLKIGKEAITEIVRLFKDMQRLLLQCKSMTREFPEIAIKQLFDELNHN